MSKTEVRRRLIEAGLPEDAASWAAESHAGGDPGPIVSELLARKLWTEVGKEDGSGAFSVRNWKQLTDNGFPFLDGGAAERLFASGADPADLDALVRSAVVLALYNVTNILDSGGWREFEEVLGDEFGEGLGWAVVVRDPAAPSQGDGIELHTSFEQADPCGRFGGPPTDALYEFARFPDGVRRSVIASLEEGAERDAALSWRRYTGQELAAARAAIRQLAENLGAAKGIESPE